MPNVQQLTIPHQTVDVTVEVKAGQAGVGSYHLRLWEPTGNTIVMDKKGTFLTPNGDTYILPLSADKLIGYFLELISVVSQVDPIMNWAINMTVKAPGMKDQTISHTGTFPSHGATVNDQIVVQFA